MKKSAEVASPDPLGCRIDGGNDPELKATKLFTFYDGRQSMGVQTVLPVTGRREGADEFLVDLATSAPKSGSEGSKPLLLLLVRGKPKHATQGKVGPWLLRGDVIVVVQTADYVPCVGFII